MISPAPPSTTRHAPILLALLCSSLLAWNAPHSARASGSPSSGGHVVVSPDGRESAPCSCRPATSEERADLRISPDGWMQDEPRASYSRGDVPLPLVPDWVGTRARAVGALAWGDADHDGDEDLAVGTYWGNMYPPIPDYYNFIYLNNNGVLESNPSWISTDQKHTCDLHWADFNRDGYPDLFVGNGGESLHPSQIFFGRDGLLPTTPGWSSIDDAWTIDAAVADFDNDGDIDLATANEGNTIIPYRPVYLFRNNGSGLEANPSWASDQVGITNGISWGDMDGDGHPDLAVAGWVGWQTGVFHNLGTTLETGFTWTTGHPERTDGKVAWSDVDGDHHLDLAVGGNGAPDWLFHNEGNVLGSLPVWASGESYHGCQDMAWVDIDQDGDGDLATINFSTGHVRIYLNNAGTLSTLADWMYDAPSSGTAIAFGDLNRDGLPDLAVGMANGPVEVFLNTGVPAGVPESAADLPSAGRLRMTASPNPFHNRVVLAVESASPLQVDRVELWDANGRRVASQAGPSGSGLASRGAGAAGHHAAAFARHCQNVSWDLAGARLSSGVYFARLVGRDAEGRPCTARARLVRVAD